MQSRSSHPWVHWLAVVVSAATCLCGSPGAAQEQQEQPGADAGAGSQLVLDAYELSKTAKSEAQYSKIIELCQQGLEAGVPKKTLDYGRKLMSWSYNRRGQLRLDNNQPDQAMNDFETSIKFDPSRWRAYHNRGYVWASRGDFKKALEDFDRTIVMSPDYAKAYFNRGEIYFAQGEFEKAINDYTEVLRRETKDSEAYNRRGTAYYQLRNFGQAQKDFNQSIRLNPKNTSALINRGDLYADVGYLENAATDYRAAINADPESDRAYLSAAWMMATCSDARFRNAEMALQAASKAIQLAGEEENPFRFRYLEVLAAAYANAGDFEQAAQIQTKATELAPESEQARFKQRVQLYASGKAYREQPPAQTQQTSTPSGSE